VWLVGFSSRSCWSNISGKFVVEDQQMICIALDIDGILVDRKGILYPSIKVALQNQWPKAHFVLISGRPPAGIEYVLRQLDRDGYYIALNGGLILAGIGKRPLKSFNIPRHTVHTLIGATAESRKRRDILSVFGYTSTEWLAWGVLEAIHEEEKVTDCKAFIVKNVDSLIVDNMIKLVLVCRDDLSWHRVARQLKTHSDRFEVTQSRPFYIEITSIETSKGIALEYLANKVKFAAVISVGDGENDIPLFEVSDCSFTVPTAHRDLQKEASCVINEPVDENLARLINILLS
jgi:Cof subfamily protein (haloacid dehalogenase superfamily)